jgi:hypothetical protein
LPPLPEISYNEFDADYESDDSPYLGGAEGKAPIILKQTEFCLKQFANRMGQPNFNAFNRGKKECVAGFLKKKDWAINLGNNHWKQQLDGPLHWENAVADVLETFEKWLPLENSDNTKWIRRE